ncbi:MAG: UDP-glucose/GDP-mannose dehydrogenase family protein [Chloroflexi bacterium]|nr:UDP-glucose/GDP-mannose dehydrogenase family protein [Chloroflexota bacterium]
MHTIFPNGVVYDKFVQEHQNTRNAVNLCRFSIICVPTPENADGSCDVSSVEDVVGWLDTPIIIIKSAVPPGTTDRLKAKYRKRIVVSPEYFGESTYYLPELFTPLGWPYLIVGGDRQDTADVVELFVPVLGPAKTYMQVDARTAELTKYMENAWLAMQVTFANEFYEIAKAHGVDYNVLREAWALDPRVSKWHTAVFPMKRGFGGKCLPKDLKAVIAAAEQAGYSPGFLKEIWASNLRFRARSPEKRP